MKGHRKSAAWSKTKRRFCRPRTPFGGPSQGAERALLCHFSTLSLHCQGVVDNLRTVKRSAAAATGGGRSPPGARERGARSATQSGAKPQRALRSREPPAGAAGRGAAGENPTTTTAPPETHPASAAGRARSQAPAPEGGNKAALPPPGAGAGAAGPEARGAPLGGRRDDATEGEQRAPRGATRCTRPKGKRSKGAR